jgi:hypothetical protein
MTDAIQDSARFATIEPPSRRGVCSHRPGSSAIAQSTCSAAPSHGGLKAAPRIIFQFKSIRGRGKQLPATLPNSRKLNNRCNPLTPAHGRLSVGLENPVQPEQLARQSASPQRHHVGDCLA